MERRVINPWTWQEKYGFHHGHEVTGAQRTLYISNQKPTDADGRAVHVGDMAGQIRQCLANLEAVLAAADMTPGHLVQVHVLTTDIDLFLQHSQEMRRLRDAGSQNTSSVVGVARLASPQFLVGIEAIAVA